MASKDNADTSNKENRLNNTSGGNGGGRSSNISATGNKTGGNSTTTNNSESSSSGGSSSDNNNDRKNGKNAKVRSNAAQTESIVADQAAKNAAVVVSGSVNNTRQNLTVIEAPSMTSR